MKQTLIWIVVLGLLSMGVILLVKYTVDSGDRGPTPTVDGTLLERQPDDLIKGNAAAAVTLIEYGDFQCPACAAYHPLLDQLLKEYGDRVAFIWRHYPLRTIHRNADLASRAAQAASLQGKFWEMYDKIFSGQKSWENSTKADDIFKGYAGEIGLDLNKWQDDLNSSAVKDKVNADIRSGDNANVTGTPTFFLDGAKVSNPRSYADFKSLIDQALNDKK